MRQTSQETLSAFHAPGGPPPTLKTVYRFSTAPTIYIILFAQIRPWVSMASATFLKPAMLAPIARSPVCPNSSAAS